MEKLIISMKVELGLDKNIEVRDTLLGGVSLCFCCETEENVL